MFARRGGLYTGDVPLRVTVPASGSRLPGRAATMVEQRSTDPWWSRERPAQAMVEFAFVSLTIMMLIFGILDLGRGVYQRSLFTNALREAARYGSVAPADLTGIRAAAARTSPSLGLTSSSPNITAVCSNWNGSAWVTVDCSAARPGDRLEVSGTYLFGLSAPRLIGWSSITMSETSIVTIQ